MGTVRVSILGGIMERLTEKIDGADRYRLKSGYGFRFRYADRKAQETIDKLAEYEDLEEQGKLMKLPCAVGDFALLSSDCILPVNYISQTCNGIIVGCQNGTTMQMNKDFSTYCKGFYKTKEEAETALQKMKETEE